MSYSTKNTGSKIPNEDILAQLRMIAPRNDPKQKDDYDVSDARFAELKIKNTENMIGTTIDEIPDKINSIKLNWVDEQQLYDDVLRDSRCLTRSTPDIIFTRLSEIYKHDIFNCVVRIYKHAPSFFTKTIMNPHQFKAFQKYFMLIEYINFINNTQDDVEISSIKDIDQIRQWVQVRHDNNIQYVINGPNNAGDGYNVKYVDKYNGLMSGSASIDDIAQSQMLTTQQNISSDLNKFLKEFREQHNAYDKLSDEARKYSINISSIKDVRIYKDEDILYFDMRGVDLGEVRDEVTETNYFTAEYEEKREITSMTNTMKLEEIMKFYSRIAIKELIIDPSLYVTNLASLSKVYIVFKGVVANERHISNVFKESDLKIPGHFIRTDRGFEFIPDTDVITYKSQMVNVRNFEMYITTGNPDDKIISNEYALTFDKNSVYNYPVEIYKDNDFSLKMQLLTDEHEEEQNVKYNLHNIEMPYLTTKVIDDLFSGMTGDWSLLLESFIDQWRKVDTKDMIIQNLWTYLGSIFIDVRNAITKKREMEVYKNNDYTSPAEIAVIENATWEDDVKEEMIQTLKQNNRIQYTKLSILTNTFDVIGWKSVVKQLCNIADINWEIMKGTTNQKKIEEGIELLKHVGLSHMTKEEIANGKNTLYKEQKYIFAKKLSKGWAPINIDGAKWYFSTARDDNNKARLYMTSGTTKLVVANGMKINGNSYNVSKDTYGLKFWKQNDTNGYTWIVNNLEQQVGNANNETVSQYFYSLIGCAENNVKSAVTGYTNTAIDDTEASTTKRDVELAILVWGDVYRALKSMLENISGILKGGVVKKGTLEWKDVDLFYGTIDGKYFTYDNSKGGQYVKFIDYLDNNFRIYTKDQADLCLYNLMTIMNDGSFENNVYGSFMYSEYQQTIQNLKFVYPSSEINQNGALIRYTFDNFYDVDYEDIFGNTESLKLYPIEYTVEDVENKNVDNWYMLEYTQNKHYTSDFDNMTYYIKTNANAIIESMLMEVPVINKMSKIYPLNHVVMLDNDRKILAEFEIFDETVTVNDTNYDVKYENNALCLKSGDEVVYELKLLSQYFEDEDDVWFITFVKDAFMMIGGLVLRSVIENIDGKNVCYMVANNDKTVNIGDSKYNIIVDDTGIMFKNVENADIVKVELNAKSVYLNEAVYDMKLYDTVNVELHSKVDENSQYYYNIANKCYIGESYKFDFEYDDKHFDIYVDNKRVDTSKYYYINDFNIYEYTISANDVNLPDEYISYMPFKTYDSIYDNRPLFEILGNSLTLQHIINRTNESSKYYEIKAGSRQIKLNLFYYEKVKTEAYTDHAWKLFINRDDTSFEDMELETKLGGHIKITNKGNMFEVDVNIPGMEFNPNKPQEYVTFQESSQDKNYNINVYKVYYNPTDADYTFSDGTVVGKKLLRIDYCVQEKCLVAVCDVLRKEDDFELSMPIWGKSISVRSGDADKKYDIVSYMIDNTWRISTGLAFPLKTDFTEKSDDIYYSLKGSIEQSFDIVIDGSKLQYLVYSDGSVTIGNVGINDVLSWPAAAIDNDEKETYLTKLPGKSLYVSSVVDDEDGNKVYEDVGLVTLKGNLYYLTSDSYDLNKDDLYTFDDEVVFDHENEPVARLYNYDLTINDGESVIDILGQKTDWEYLRLMRKIDGEWNVEGNDIKIRGSENELYNVVFQYNSYRTDRYIKFDDSYFGSTVDTSKGSDEFKSLVCYPFDITHRREPVYLLNNSFRYEGNVTNAAQIMKWDLGSGFRYDDNGVYKYIADGSYIVLKSSGENNAESGTTESGATTTRTLYYKDTSGTYQSIDFIDSIGFVYGSTSRKITLKLIDNRLTCFENVNWAEITNQDDSTEILIPEHAYNVYDINGNALTTSIASNSNVVYPSSNSTLDKPYTENYAAYNQIDNKFLTKSVKDKLVDSSRNEYKLDIPGSDSKIYIDIFNFERIAFNKSVDSIPPFIEIYFKRDSQNENSYNVFWKDEDVFHQIFNPDRDKSPLQYSNIVIKDFHKIIPKSFVVNNENILQESVNGKILYYLDTTLGYSTLKDDDSNNPIINSIELQEKYIVSNLDDEAYLKSANPERYLYKKVKLADNTYQYTLQPASDFVQYTLKEQIKWDENGNLYIETAEDQSQTKAIKLYYSIIEDNKTIGFERAKFINKSTSDSINLSVIDPSGAAEIGYPYGIYLSNLGNYKIVNPNNNAPYLIIDNGEDRYLPIVNTQERVEFIYQLSTSTELYYRNWQNPSGELITLVDIEKEHVNFKIVIQYVSYSFQYYRPILYINEGDSSNPKEFTINPSYFGTKSDISKLPENDTDIIDPKNKFIKIGSKYYILSMIRNNFVLIDRDEKILTLDNVVTNYSTGSYAKISENSEIQYQIIAPYILYNGDSEQRIDFDIGNGNLSAFAVLDSVKSYMYIYPNNPTYYDPYEKYTLTEGGEISGNKLKSKLYVPNVYSNAISISPCTDKGNIIKRIDESENNFMYMLPIEMRNNYKLTTTDWKNYEYTKEGSNAKIELSQDVSGLCTGKFNNLVPNDADNSKIYVSSGKLQEYEEIKWESDTAEGVVCKASDEGIKIENKYTNDTKLFVHVIYNTININCSESGDITDDGYESFTIDFDNRKQESDDEVVKDKYIIWKDDKEYVELNGSTGSFSTNDSQIINVYHEQLTECAYDENSVYTAYYLYYFGKNNGVHDIISIGSNTYNIERHQYAIVDGNIYIANGNEITIENDTYVIDDETQHVDIDRKPYIIYSSDDVIRFNNMFYIPTDNKYTISSCRYLKYGEEGDIKIYYENDNNELYVDEITFNVKDEEWIDIDEYNKLQVLVKSDGTKYIQYIGVEYIVLDESVTINDVSYPVTTKRCVIIDLNRKIYTEMNDQQEEYITYDNAPYYVSDNTVTIQDIYYTINSESKVNIGEVYYDLSNEYTASTVEIVRYGDEVLPVQTGENEEKYVTYNNKIYNVVDNAVTIDNVIITVESVLSIIIRNIPYYANTNNYIIVNDEIICENNGYYIYNYSSYQQSINPLIKKGEEYYIVFDGFIFKDTNGKYNEMNNMYMYVANDITYVPKYVDSVKFDGNEYKILKNNYESMVISNKYVVISGESITFVINENSYTYSVNYDNSNITLSSAESTTEPITFSINDESVTIKINDINYKYYIFVDQHNNVVLAEKYYNISDGLNTISDKRYYIAFDPYSRIVDVSNECTVVDKNTITYDDGIAGKNSTSTVGNWQISYNSSEWVINRSDNTPPSWIRYFEYNPHTSKLSNVNYINQNQSITRDNIIPFKQNISDYDNEPSRHNMCIHDPVSDPDYIYEISFDDSTTYNEKSIITPLSFNTYKYTNTKPDSEKDSISYPIWRDTDKQYYNQVWQIESIETNPDEISLSVIDKNINTDTPTIITNRFYVGDEKTYIYIESTKFYDTFDLSTYSLSLDNDTISSKPFNSSKSIYLLPGTVNPVKFDISITKTPDSFLILYLTTEIETDNSTETVKINIINEDHKFTSLNNVSLFRIIQYGTNNYLYYIQMIRNELYMTELSKTRTNSYDSSTFTVDYDNTDFIFTIENDNVKYKDDTVAKLGEYFTIDTEEKTYYFQITVNEVNSNKYVVNIYNVKGQSSKWQWYIMINNLMYEIYIDGESYYLLYNDLLYYPKEDESYQIDQNQDPKLYISFENEIGSYYYDDLAEGELIKKNSTIRRSVKMEGVKTESRTTTSNICPNLYPFIVGEIEKQYTSPVENIVDVNRVYRDIVSNITEKHNYKYNSGELYDIIYDTDKNEYTFKQTGVIAKQNDGGYIGDTYCIFSNQYNGTIQIKYDKSVQTKHGQFILSIDNDSSITYYIYGISNVVQFSKSYPIKEDDTVIIGNENVYTKECKVVYNDSQKYVSYDWTEQVSIENNTVKLQDGEYELSTPKFRVYRETALSTYIQYSESSDNNVNYVTFGYGDNVVYNYISDVGNTTYPFGTINYKGKTIYPYTLRYNNSDTNEYAIDSELYTAYINTAAQMKINETSHIELLESSNQCQIIVSDEEKYNIQYSNNKFMVSWSINEEIRPMYDANITYYRKDATTDDYKKITYIDRNDYWYNDGGNKYITSGGDNYLNKYDITVTSKSDTNEKYTWSKGVLSPEPTEASIPAIKVDYGIRKQGTESSSTMFAYRLITINVNIDLSNKTFNILAFGPTVKNNNLEYYIVPVTRGSNTETEKSFTNPGEVIQCPNGTFYISTEGQLVGIVESSEVTIAYTCNISLTKYEQSSYLYHIVPNNFPGNRSDIITHAELAGPDKHYKDEFALSKAIYNRYYSTDGPISTNDLIITDDPTSTYQMSKFYWEEDFNGYSIKYSESVKLETTDTREFTFKSNLDDTYPALTSNRTVYIYTALKSVDAYGNIYISDINNTFTINGYTATWTPDYPYNITTKYSYTRGTKNYDLIRYGDYVELSDGNYYTIIQNVDYWNNNTISINNTSYNILYNTDGIHLNNSETDITLKQYSQKTALGETGYSYIYTNHRYEIYDQNSNKTDIISPTFYRLIRNNQHYYIYLSEPVIINTFEYTFYTLDSLLLVYFVKVARIDDNNMVTLLDGTVHKALYAVIVDDTKKPTHLIECEPIKTEYGQFKIDNTTYTFTPSDNEYLVSYNTSETYDTTTTESFDINGISIKYTTSENIPSSSLYFTFNSETTPTKTYTENGYIRFGAYYMYQIINGVMYLSTDGSNISYTFRNNDYGVSVEDNLMNKFTCNNIVINGIIIDNITKTTNLTVGTCTYDLSLITTLKNNSKFTISNISNNISNTLGTFTYDILSGCIKYKQTIYLDKFNKQYTDSITIYFKSRVNYDLKITNSLDPTKYYYSYNNLYGNINTPDTIASVNFPCPYSFNISYNTPDLTCTLITYNEIHLIRKTESLSMNVKFKSTEKSISLKGITSLTEPLIGKPENTYCIKYTSGENKNITCQNPKMNFYIKTESLKTNATLPLFLIEKQVPNKSRALIYSKTYIYNDNIKQATYNSSEGQTATIKLNGLSENQEKYLISGTLKLTYDDDPFIGYLVGGLSEKNLNSIISENKSLDVGIGSCTYEYITYHNLKYLYLENVEITGGYIRYDDGDTITEITPKVSSYENLIPSVNERTISHIPIKSIESITPNVKDQICLFEAADVYVYSSLIVNTISRSVRIINDDKETYIIQKSDDDDNKYSFIDSLNDHYYYESDENILKSQIYKAFIKPSNSILYKYWTRNQYILSVLNSSLNISSPKLVLSDICDVSDSKPLRVDYYTSDGSIIYTFVDEPQEITNLNDSYYIYPDKITDIDGNKLDLNILDISRHKYTIYELNNPATLEETADIEIQGKYLDGSKLEKDMFTINENSKFPISNYSSHENYDIISFMSSDVITVINNLNAQLGTDAENYIVNCNGVNYVAFIINDKDGDKDGEKYIMYAPQNAENKFIVTKFGNKIDIENININEYIYKQHTEVNDNTYLITLSLNGLSVVLSNPVNDNTAEVSIYLSNNKSIKSVSFSETINLNNLSMKSSEYTISGTIMSGEYIYADKYSLLIEWENFYNYDNEANVVRNTLYIHGIQLAYNEDDRIRISIDNNTTYLQYVQTPVYCNVPGKYYELQRDDLFKINVSKNKFYKTYPYIRYKQDSFVYPAIKDINNEYIMTISQNAYNSSMSNVYVRSINNISIPNGVNANICNNINPYTTYLSENISDRLIGVGGIFKGNKVISEMAMTSLKGYILPYTGKMQMTVEFN